MSRRTYAPGVGLVNELTVLSIAHGGTGAQTETAALTALNVLPITALGVANGVTPLDSAGLINNAYIGTLIDVPVLRGPKRLALNQSQAYSILNYSNFTTYTPSASNGTVNVSSNVLTYTAPSLAGAYGFTLNGRSFGITIEPTPIYVPTITAPVDLSTGVSVDVSIHSTAFGNTGTADTHASSDWELATDVGFGTIVQQLIADVSALTIWPITGLSAATTYYVRVRHNGTSNGAGVWSDPIRFTTA